MKKKWPNLISDEEAKRFVETADLTEFDFTNAKPVRIKFEKRTVGEFMSWSKRVVADRAAAKRAPKKWFDSEATENRET